MGGLGDLVHMIAKPVAAMLDAIAGTDLQGCGGCAERQAKWNEAVPFGRK